jgi:hypothetical protein
VAKVDFLAIVVAFAMAIAMTKDGLMDSCQHWLQQPQVPGTVPVRTGWVLGNEALPDAEGGQHSNMSEGGGAPVAFQNQATSSFTT